MAVNLNAGEAVVLVDAPPMVLTVTGGPVLLQAAEPQAAVIAGQVALHIGTLVAGDYFANAIEISGSPGTQSIDLENTTLEDGEPDAGSAEQTFWVTWAGDGGGFVTFTSQDETFDHWLQLYQGTTLEELQLVAEAKFEVGDDDPVSLQAFIALGDQPYYLRLRPDTDDPGPNDFDLTWTFSDEETELVVDMTPEIGVTPGSVVASIGNAIPGETVQFYLNGNLLTTVEVDATGTLTGFSIPLPALAVGTYSITVVGVQSGNNGFGVVNVLSTGTAYPTAQPPDNAPTEIPQTGALHWVLQDPAPSGLGSYVMPYNPTTMTPPNAPRAFTVEMTTAPNGQAHFWEASTRAREWRFTGYLDDETTLAKLEAFYRLNRRFYIIDHRNRAWVVTIDKLDAKPETRPELQWTHRYDVTALIYEGPVTPT